MSLLLTQLSAKEKKSPSHSPLKKKAEETKENVHCHNKGWESHEGEANDLDCADLRKKAGMKLEAKMTLEVKFDNVAGGSHDPNVECHRNLFICPNEHPLDKTAQ